MAYEYVVACICEGTAERVIIDKLLDCNKLIFARENLLDGEIIRCRDAQNFQRQYLGKSYKNKIIVYRILDSRREQFTLGKAYADKVEVINVITAPEIEMLIIINENKFQDFQKIKSSMKPSIFCKNVLGYHYVKSKEFVEKYFSDVNLLIASIKEYKRLSNVKNNELCIADLLQE